MPFVSRDRASLLQVNRKLERKVKDMAMQLDDECHALRDQKDQVRGQPITPSCTMHNGFFQFISDTRIIHFKGAKGDSSEKMKNDWLRILSLHKSTL